MDYDTSICPFKFKEVVFAVEIAPVWLWMYEVPILTGYYFFPGAT